MVFVVSAMNTRAIAAAGTAAGRVVAAATAVQPTSAASAATGSGPGEVSATGAVSAGGAEGEGAGGWIDDGDGKPRWISAGGMSDGYCHCTIRTLYAHRPILAHDSFQELQPSLCANDSTSWLLSIRMNVLVGVGVNMLFDTVSHISMMPMPTMRALTTRLFQSCIINQITGQVQGGD